ncbi:MAG TPA: DUF1800 domain-containing protein [Pyrinomonadaceae bacterium]|jgi:uncharacterized protein (DUF1800 family)
MTVESNPRAYARRLLVCALLLLLALARVPPASAQAPPAGSPVLLTEGTGATTRGVAYESVTFRSEPFPVVSPYNWNADKSNTRDRQTRVTVFAMNLALLPGECGRDQTANCSIPLTADAQDAAGRVYPLRVEGVTRPKYVQLQPVAGSPGRQEWAEGSQDWLYAVTLRLDEAMTDALGDVLVRVNLHGLASNRVRIAVGQTGAGPAVDAATEFAAPAPAAAPAPTPYPTPKAYGPGEASAADATRLLEQATWGPTVAEVARVRQMGLRAFVDEQLNAVPLNPAKDSNFADLEFMPDDANLEAGCPATRPSDPTYVQANCLRDKYRIYPVQVQFFKNALAAADAADPQGLTRRDTQLRQRVAFALHQIFVVSNVDIPFGFQMTPYLQALDRGAFNNFRTMLGMATVNPAMGEYLNMNQSTATNPNENFAREILQLFSVGVNQLKADGTPVLDAQGLPVPTYTQATVNEFTRVFTGWRFATGLQVGSPPAGALNFRDPMEPRGGTTHDTGPKTLFGRSLPGCPGANNNTNPTNAQCAREELNAALDVIFNHPNVGPFVSKQLIQHLVTSNPSPSYVGRVAAVFNNDCQGLYPEGGCGSARGNMRAVVRAVLLDPEARGDVKTASDYGRLREPVQYITNVLRAFNSVSDGVLGSFNRSGDMPLSLDQPLFQPATVFSYYSPDYEVPGTKTAGPAFQILYTTTTIRRANLVNTLIYTGIPTGPNNPVGTRMTWEAPDALAGVAGQPMTDEQAAGLVNYMDSLLLHGTMSPQVREAVKAAVKAISPSDPLVLRKRSQAAAYLVLTSPHYDVQR